MDGVRALLRGEGIIQPFRAPADPELQPLVGEVRALLREVDSSRRNTERGAIWTPERLRSVLRDELAGDDVHARLQPRAVHPHAARRADPHTASGQRPRDGARAGHARVLRHVDRARQRHRGPRRPSTRTTASTCRPTGPRTRCAASGSRDEEERGYYYGFANEGLWPLCHIAHVRPVFRIERLGAVRPRQRAVRGRGGRGSEEPTIRSCSSRTITSRCCRA